MKLVLFVIALAMSISSISSICCPTTKMFFSGPSCYPYEDDYYMGSGNEGDLWVYCSRNIYSIVKHIWHPHKTSVEKCNAFHTFLTVKVDEFQWKAG